MDRTGGDNFKFNTETEFVPILALEAQLNSTEGAPKSSTSATSIQDNHHPALLSLLASELSVAPELIHDFEVFVDSAYQRMTTYLTSRCSHLFDVQPSVLGGLNSELVYSPRMDNQFSS